MIFWISSAVPLHKREARFRRGKCRGATWVPTTLHDATGTFYDPGMPPTPPPSCSVL